MICRQRGLAALLKSVFRSERQIVEPRTDLALPSGLDADDLPTWMRYPRRRIDWGILLALALGLLSVWPFITRGGLPRGTALEFHVYRAAEMADALRGGAVYPRWAADALYGYGLPLFNYTAPAVPYLAALFQLITENSAVDGVRFVLIVGALAGAAGMFAFVRRRWGPLAGLVAVETYTLSPSLLYLLPHGYGDLPFLLGLQLLPGAFWSIDRLLAYSRARDLWISVGIIALLALSDEQSAPWLLLVVVGWLIWLGLMERGGSYRLAWGALLLGIGLAATFWLPALAEQQQVFWFGLEPTVVESPLTLGELLAPARSADQSLFNPVAQRNLGLATWTLALGAAGGVLFVRSCNGRRFSLPLQDRCWLYVVVLAGPLLTLALNPTELVEPQLVLGVLAFLLAVMAGRATIWLDVLRRLSKGIGLALLVALPLMSALPLLNPAPWPSDFGGTDAMARLQFELNDYGLATVPPGRAVPLPMPVLPQPSRLLVESYISSSVDRVNRTVLDAGQVNVIEQRGAWVHLLVSAAVPLRIPFYISAFPGWRVVLDGHDTPLDVSDASGLLYVEMPGGVHDVQIYFGSTPARDAGWGLSLVSLLAAAALGLALVRGQAGKASVAELPLLSSRQALIAAGTLGAFLVMLVLLIGQPGLIWPRSSRGSVQEASAPFRRYVQTGFDLLAYRLGRTVFAPGDALDLTLYWRAVRPIHDNFQITVSLVDANNGLRTVQSYRRHIGGYPTSRWPRDRYIRDSHRLQIPPSLMPGTYLLVVELWQCEVASPGVCQTARRLAFFDERGAPVGDSLALPVIMTVTS